MEIIKGKKAKPRRVMLYGTHGIGKSTWAANSPNPIFLACEDGLDDIGADRTPLLKDAGEFNSCMSQLINEPHEYKTIVVDTIDWLEKLIWSYTASKNNKKSIEEISYGKGYSLALAGWEWVLKTLDALRESRGMSVVLLAHACITKHSPPEGDPYDRYSPDLHKTVAPMLQEWCDEVLFARYEINTITRDEGFGRNRARAIGSGERIVFTSEQPTHLAKRRLKMPDQIPLDWSEYQKHWPTGGSSNIGGLVVNGSSKKEIVKNVG